MAPSTHALKKYQHGSSWALVTGATSGMGQEWAYQLAALGFNVIIHGRNQSKLDSVKATIKTKSPSVEVKTAIADAGACPPKLDQLLDIFKSGLKLTIVINNVGVVSQSYPLLEEVPEEELLSQVTTNAIFPTLVAHKTLPLLKQNQPSLMVNVASLGAWAPTPYLTPYSGAKAYNLHFSHSLYNEMICENTKVDVVAMVPGTVISGMNEGPPTAMMPTSETWVKKAIGSLSPGIFSSRPSPIIVPHSPHAWGNRILGWMGRSLGDQTVRNVTVDMRKKKMASETSSPALSDKKKPATMAAPAVPMEKTSSTNESEANGHATSSANTSIEDATDAKKV
jgi:17beta-estradiol 17-dehydrogenase / very-long-chain 3-oxoacyl-CoA reductase